MKVEESILNIKQKIDNNFVEALDEQQPIIAEVYELISCYTKRSENLKLDDLVEEIVSDLFTALYFSLSGFYRQSYISLRCVIEMGVSLFRFKDNNYSYLLWKQNKEDISWSIIKNNDNGILSNNYWRLFKEGDYNKFNLHIIDCYRECSEYVHGKDKYIKNLKDFKVQYNKDLCYTNLKMCKTVVSFLITGLSIRFGNTSDAFYALVEEYMKEYEVD